VKNLLTTLLLLATLAALLGACRGSTDGPWAPADSATQSTPAEVPERRAVEVAPALLQAIADGQQAGVGMQPLRGVAVRSQDFAEVWMVAVRFTATGVGLQTGVWATNNLTSGAGLILSVDATARACTVWPNAAQTDPGITPFADGVSEARDALY